MEPRYISYKLNELYVTHDDIQSYIETNLSIISAMTRYMSSIIDHIVHHQWDSPKKKEIISSYYQSFGVFPLYF